MNVAFIPVRGGSKSIPLKNVRPINGKPLVYWTMKAACGCKYIDTVYISTDSDQIKSVIENLKNGTDAVLFSKVIVIGRSKESASDTASTEFAMLEFANKYSFDNIVLIQATSPLLQSFDLDRGFETFYSDYTDSVLSAVRQKRFNWGNDTQGFAHPTNYDVFHRPRRQEFDGYLVENGAFYITSKENLIKSKNRVSGNIRIVEMSEDTYFEIDEPHDWIVIEALMKKNGMSASSVIPEIKMFLTDCDGCLTDAGMYYSEKGDELKKFNTRDGMGFSFLKEHGIITGIITSENVDLNRRRAEKLKLNELIVGCKEKVQAIMALCEKYNILPENVCYVGDDVNDIEALKFVGFGCCPNDAVPKVKEVAKYISPVDGGKGVIRDVAEKIEQKNAADYHIV